MHCGVLAFSIFASASLKPCLSFKAVNHALIKGKMTVPALVFEGYSDVKEIGKGGYGKVYKALSNKDETVVIKQANSEEHAEALSKEAEILQKVMASTEDYPEGCPRVVKFIDFVRRPPQLPYLVMTPYANDGDLDEAKRPRSAMQDDPILHTDGDEAQNASSMIRFATQVLETLECFSSRNIIFSDLKLANLLIKPGQQGKGLAQFLEKSDILLTDFGLAFELKDEEAIAASKGELHSGRTCSFTVETAAPEALAESRIYEGFTWSFDMFSFGAVLLQLFRFNGASMDLPMERSLPKQVNARGVQWCDELSDFDQFTSQLGQNVGSFVLEKVGIKNKCLRELIGRSLALLPKDRISPTDALTLVKAASISDEKCDAAVAHLPAPAKFTPEACTQALHVKAPSFSQALTAEGAASLAQSFSY